MLWVWSMWDDAGTSCWLDGKPSFSSLNWHRGLHYGDGVFRTMLKINDAIVDVNCQLVKLEEDCDALGIQFDRARVERCLFQAAAGVQAAVLKLVIARAPGGRGYQSFETDSEILALRTRLPDYPASLWSRGVVASFSQVRLAGQPALAGVKHLNRLEQVLASRSWPTGIQERILCDMEDRPISGTRTNLFWTLGNRLITPSLSMCGVAGVMRKKLLALAEEAGIEAVIGDQSLSTLMAADEVLLCNSLIGIWPIRKLESRIWPTPGHITRRLASILAHPWQGYRG